MGFAEQDRLRNMLRALRGCIPKPYTQQKWLTPIRSVLDRSCGAECERRFFRGLAVGADGASGDGKIRNSNIEIETHFEMIEFRDGSKRTLRVS